jgi:hypothetical protein
VFTGGHSVWGVGVILRMAEVGRREGGPERGRRPLVYLSGPITASVHGSVEEHVAAGLRVYLALVKRGVPTVCPQLSGAFPSAWQVSWEEWLAHDFAVIERCTHVVLLPGWETSRGARAEKGYAEEIGVRVLEWWDEAIEALA